MIGLADLDHEEPDPLLVLVPSIADLVPAVTIKVCLPQKALLYMVKQLKERVSQRKNVVKAKARSAVI